METPPASDPYTDTLEQWFNDGLDGYQAEDVWVDHPGKRLFTATDPDGDRLHVNWEGDDRFSYDQHGQTRPLEEDDPLYDVATDMLAAYPALHFDAEGRIHYRMLSHTNAGGEASRALNEPLEWGVENDYRTWDQRQQDHGLTGWVARLLGRDG